MSDVPIRYVALDVHQAYVMVAALDAHQTIVLQPHRIPLVQFEAWATHCLHPTDHVVLEATSNAWAIADRVQPLVARVVVANPLKLKLIAASTVKTDRRDTLALARLLAANLVPEVWVPPAHVRELRALIAHRQRLVRQRTMAKNRLRSLLQRHQIVPSVDNPFAATHRAWWDTLSLAPAERLRAHHDLAVLDYLAGLLGEVEAELAQLSGQAPWVTQVPFLLQLPGIGLTTAMTVLSAIGDIDRFPSAKHLVGYSGLGNRVHASGQVERRGGITKQGRPELRTALVEAAWAAVRADPGWRERFEALAARIGQAKAIVALARKLLVVVWHVLRAQCADRHADATAVARRFLRWGSRHRRVRQAGQSRAAFVRAHLDQLGLGAQVTELRYGREVLKLQPRAPCSAG